MSSSSESHGTHDLNAPAMSQDIDPTEVRALKRIYDKLAEQGGGTWATYMLMEIKEWEELRKSTLITTLTAERDSWKAACMEAREGCNQRSGTIRSLRSHLEASQALVQSMREALEACASILPRYRMAGKTAGDDEELAAVLETVTEALSDGEAKP